LVKIVNNRGQFKITLPKDIVESKGWDSGTRLRFLEDPEGNIILKPFQSPNEIRDKRKRPRSKP
jgi:bifunctional DNA-binding transcriptional regulator/antitoxin component of YhaV-PrlF toxin-antitoxin module